MLLLQLDFVLPQFPQLREALLGVAVPDGGGRVALPALGALGDLGPALGTDQVLSLTGEDLTGWYLQADWALQVGLQLLDGFLLLVDTLGEEGEKSPLLTEALDKKTKIRARIFGVFG